MKELESRHFDINGIWEVTTEGDVEGRSTKQLGTHPGNLFEIVKQLNGQSYYSLRLKRVGHINPQELNTIKKREAHFTVVDTYIKLFDKNDQINKLKTELPDGHQLTESNFYGAIKLVWED